MNLSELMKWNETPKGRVLSWLNWPSLIFSGIIFQRLRYEVAATIEIYV